MSKSVNRLAASRTAVLMSVAAMGLALFGIAWNSSGHLSGVQEHGDKLVVYCASGLRTAVEPLIAKYQRDYGVETALRFGPSGAIEAQAELSGEGDLIIPAALNPFLDRLRADGRVREILPVAELCLVVALAPGVDAPPDTLDDLLRSSLRFGLCNLEAAAGQRTYHSLRPTGRWDEVAAVARVSLPTVTELAEAIRDGGQLDAGVIWSTTADQFGLEHVDLPELRGSTSVVAVGVLESTSDPSAALRLARYITSRDRGQPAFALQHFDCLPGDKWAEQPRIQLFSGTVNRMAILESLAEFEHREGCAVTTVFDGCGVLVGQMRAGALPDCYFACDVSYVQQVSERFGPPTEVSENPMVIVTRKENPKGIKELTDLTRDDVMTGMCDPELTALGALTQRMLSEAGLYERVINTGARTITTGDLLVAQMLAGDRLDAAIVYRANCAAAEDKLEVLGIDHPLARAIQPFTVRLDTDHPLLASRLRDYLTSAVSRERFEAWGFKWRAPVTSE